MREAERVWKSKADAELEEAAKNLESYTVEAEDIIRHELKRRGLTVPPPVERFQPEPSRAGPSPGTAALLALLFGPLGLAYVRGWGVALQATFIAIALTFAILWLVPLVMLVAYPLALIGFPVYAHRVAKQQAEAAREAATRCSECGALPPDHKSWCTFAKAPA